MVQARIDALPQEITDSDAVRYTYADDLNWISDKLHAGLSVLVECDAQLTNQLYSELQALMRSQNRAVPARSLRSRDDDGNVTERDPAVGQVVFHYIRGTRQAPQEEEGAGGAQPPAGNLIQRMMNEIEGFVQAAPIRRVLVIPHLDILVTTTKSGLGAEARILLSYLDNPDLLVLAFKDPEYEIPEAIARAFPGHRSIIGVQRERLVPPASIVVEGGQGSGRATGIARRLRGRTGAGPAQAAGGGLGLITREEASKFGLNTFDPYSLYKYLSGVNAIRVRQILRQFHGRPDFDPANPESRDQILHEIREMTLAGDVRVDRVDLDRDIGGYADVKEKVREILRLVQLRDEAETIEQVKSIEEEIPRGILFEGPPGTGKTYFAKALATAIDATVIVVSGPELKSKWVGESEQNLRNIFTRARKSAPAVIIFDEIDSLATARDDAQSGADHGIVNTLLTEMDGFRKEELVFVVGTTNLVTSLDPALLRPGRFEFKIRVGAPKDGDRKAIFETLFRKAGLDCPPDVLEGAVRLTAGYADSAARRNFAGDDLRAIVSKIRRARRLSPDGGLRERVVTREEVERAIREVVVGGKSSGGFEKPDVDFKTDIAGYGDVKKKIRREFLDLLEIRDRLVREGASDQEIARLESRIPRGILLWGPPGTGKTYFAKALATALGGSLIVISASELKSKFYGETEQNIRDVFAEARSSAPAVIVFDELDALARKRSAGGDDFGSNTDDSIINTLLTEMDGFRGDELVFVVGTTNRPDTLDPALLRPSRLGLKVEVPAPNSEDRKAILEHYARLAGLEFAPEDLKRLVAKTAGFAAPDRRFAGDDLRAIVESISNQKMRSKYGYKENPGRRKNPERVVMSEIDAALEEVGGEGASGEARQLTAEEKQREKRVTAYHECGHALMSALTPGCSFPFKVSIDAPEDADFLGITMKEARAGNLNRQEMLAEIGAALAGRIAEKVIGGESDSGAQNDLQQATALASVMVTELGMSEKLGPVVYGRRHVSPEFERVIDEEIRDIVKGEYARVQSFLEGNRDLLDKMAALLLEKKTLEALDLAKFFTENGFGEYVPRSLAGQVVVKNSGRKGARKRRR